MVNVPGAAKRGVNDINIQSISVQDFFIFIQNVKRLYIPVVLRGSPEALYSLEVSDLRFYCLS